MKERVLFLIIMGGLLLLTSCGNETLVIRTPLEGDNYIRNNIEQLDWSLFSNLIANTSEITEPDFLKLKNSLEENPRTRYILVNNELFRFNPGGKMLYYSEWIEENGFYKLDLIEIPNYNAH